MESPFRSDVLKGRVALVTGGGSGIGFGVAKALGTHGAKVAIMGRRLAVLEKACAELASCGVEAYAVQGDVRDPALAQQAIEQTIEQWGQLNVLVNGAAGNFLCCPEDLSPNGFKTVVDIDLNGTFNMCRYAYEHLKQDGLILNISATLHYTGTPFQLAVSAAKSGLDALTINLATEWGADGIRVCGIAPGPIGDTEGMARLVPPDVRAEMLKLMPLGRFGTTQDIGLAAVYLASSAGSFVSGTTWVVDGGQWAAKPSLVPRDLVKQLAKSHREG
ncbi:MAG: SDR family oxidoreductase [Gammaproteobacteria bacterium]